MDRWISRIRFEMVLAFIWPGPGLQGAREQQGNSYRAVWKKQIMLANDGKQLPVLDG